MKIATEPLESLRKIRKCARGGLTNNTKFSGE